MRPRAIVDRLYRETEKALRTPGVMDKFKPQGIEPMPMTSAEFDALVGALDDETLDGAVISGPDPEPYLAAIRRAVGAGFRTVYLHQVGPDQEGFFRFYADRVMPLL